MIVDKYPNWLAHDMEDIFEIAVDSRRFYVLGLRKRGQDFYLLDYGDESWVVMEEDVRLFAEEIKWVRRNQMSQEEEKVSGTD